MKIVVGYDGSEAAKRALAKAAELAGGGGSVAVVSVVTVHAGAVRGAMPVDPDELAERSAELGEAKSILGQSGVEPKLVEGRGDPADAIVEEAQASGADLVIVGTHGQNVVERSLMGSVSTSVVHQAPCDVLVVR
jgi:nucleotide-binding universal stress UspA family protein